MGWNFPLSESIPAHFLPALSYSFSAGRNTAITKCAKFEAPSSSCSQRTTQCSARQQVADGDTQRLASFHIVIARQIRIGQDKYARPYRSLVRFFQFGGRAGH